jgi:PAS domain S-box-containing protein
MITYLEHRGYRRTLGLLGVAVVALVGVVVAGGWLAYRADVRRAQDRVAHEAAQRVALLEVVARATRPAPGRLDPAQETAWFRAFLAELHQVVADPDGAPEGEAFWVLRDRGDSLAVLLGNGRRTGTEARLWDSTRPPAPAFDPTVPVRTLDRAAPGSEVGRRALAGESGTLTGPGLHGEGAVAAYAPAVFGLAVVSEIHLADLRGPYIRSGLAVLGVILLLAFLSWLFLARMQRYSDRAGHFVATLLDGVRGGVLGVDATGQVVLMNHSARDLLGDDFEGTRPADWPGRLDVRDPTTGREMEVERLPIRRALAGEHVQDAELEVSVEGGESRHLVVTATPLVDAAGVELGAAVTWVDATEQRQAEQALEASRSRLGLAVDAAQQGLYDLDLRTGKVAVSDRYALMLGYDPADFVETNARWIERMHPDDRAVTLRRFDDYLGGRGDRFEAEFRLRTRTGSWRWILSLGKVVERDGEGRPLRVMGTHTDVTRRKRAEEDRDRLAQAIEQAGEMVMITDREGKIQYVNPAFESITGYPRSEVLGATPRVLKSGEHDQAFYDDFWSRLTAGETIRTTFVNRRKAGDLYTQAAVISPFRDRGGSVVGYVTVARDVTRERELEDQLREADKLRALGQLAGGVAHDFNNELTVVLANTRMGREALDEADRELHEEALREIHDAAHRASDLTESLLTFARKSPMKRRPLELGELLGDVAGTLRRVLPETIEVETRIPGSGPVVLADPGVVGQVLLNLATNARDAMPDGGRLTLTLDQARVPRHLTAVRSATGPHARLTVSDTGVGISDRELERIFEPFYTTKEPGEGTGLGLAMVYALLEQAEAFVDVSSTRGRGTSFRLYLPLSDQEVETEAAGREVPEPGRGNGEMVLLAEDEEALRTAARKMLERAGYRVAEARDGVEAWEVFQERGAEVDLVLSDLVMPRRGGQDLLQAIHRASPATPLILTSGHARSPVAENGEALDYVFFLPKPWSGEDLLHVVRQRLDLSPSDLEASRNAS